MLRQAALCVLLFSISFESQAAGGITHMFIANEIIAQLPDKELHDLIEKNKDAYLVGSNYPDTGFIRGTHYGNDSNWEPFIHAFVEYLHERYLYPEQQNPALVAFLLGCATHVVSDEVFNGVFMNKVAAEDFHGNWQKAYAASSRGLDFLITIEKAQWNTRPVIWWLPLHDLIGVYKKEGKTHYSEVEILWGNAIYSLNGLSERALSPISYYYTKKHMPWLAKNYYTSPQGGMRMTEEVTMNYVLRLWKEITRKTFAAKKLDSSPIPNPAFVFVKKQLSTPKRWSGNYHVEYI